MIKLTEFKKTGSMSGPPAGGSSRNKSTNPASRKTYLDFPYPHETQFIRTTTTTRAADPFKFNYSGAPATGAVFLDDFDNDHESFGRSQVYIRCPGRPMPFYVLVILAGLVQMDLGIFALYFWTACDNIYKWFPQYGTVLLAHQDGAGYLTGFWFAMEIIIGLWLVLNVWFKCSRHLFTIWLWTILSLLMSSLVTFCWNLPFQYERHGYEIGGKFLLQLLFHLLLTGIGREYYKQQYPISAGDTVTFVPRTITIMEHREMSLRN